MQNNNAPLKNRAFTWPNIITLMRLVLVPIIIYLMIKAQWQAAFWLFVIAGISDGVDGFIARRFNQGSELGAYLDPVADKALLIGIFILLAINHAVPLWLVVTMVARDIFIIVGFLISFLMNAGLQVKPLFISKATTAIQITLAAFIFSAKAFSFDTGLVGDMLIYGAAVLTLASAAAYGRVWFSHMAKHEDQ